MKFSEKLKKARQDAGMTQQGLADALGVSLRTITNYETGDRYPRKRELYGKMAELLGLDINYLLTEDEEFVVQAEESYGRKGANQARELIAQVGGLFAGGELAEEDMDEMMQAIQEAYWIAKKNNRKYTPKRYLSNDNSDSSNIPDRSDASDTHEGK